MQHLFIELKKKLAEIQDLHEAAGVLEWDQYVMMPPRGAAARAEALATLERLAHEKFVDPAIGHMLENLQPYEESLPADSDEASLIRVTRRDYDKARRVPAELAAEIVRTASLAQEAWVEARERADFALFLPHLEKNVALKRRYIDCFEPGEEVYDLLLDDFEPGAKTKQVRALFDEVKAALVPLIAACANSRVTVDDTCLHGHFDVEKQRLFCLQVISHLGYTPDSWRLDTAVHPFTSSFSTSDARITTRYEADFINAGLFGAMHECGHGLYDSGISPALERTPLRNGASSALHESQSRLWENLVGRSQPFWRYFYPRLQAVFPEAFGGVEMATFYRAVNKVQPSFIRVEADEATYALHIILRFELEQEMFTGRLQLRELPEAWNARMKEYLGLNVPNDALGVLQDVHWSDSLFGYFPTYALGNIISAQIWEQVGKVIPDLDEQFERGEFGALRDWLGENIYRHGRKFMPIDTLARAVGGTIQVQPYINYLTHKFGEIYRLG